MDYAKENDGTPNTIIAAIMFKAVSRIWESNRKVKQISARISENYRADVGCPNTYRDLIRQLHVKYDKKMKDWPVGKLSTLTRGRMFLQMEPEISWQEYQALLAFRNAIDEQKTHKKKCQYARKHSLLAHGITDSYTGSYVGQLDWGGLGQYIKAVHTIADGHLKIDVNAVDDKFFINFEQVNRDKKYLNAFFDVLTEEGIPFILGEMQDKRLPKLSL